MKHLDVAAILDRAKNALKIAKDQELAKNLGIPRGTIASWKRRKSIPAKYLSEMTSFGISLDWLLTGQGETYSPDIVDLPLSDYVIDNEALWIGLLLMTRHLYSEGNEEEQNFMLKLTKKRLYHFHVYLSMYYSKVLKSKKSWKSSKVVSDENIYNALVVEYDLGDFDFHAPPWWDDEELI